MSEDISKKVLDKISCDKICPTPKWCFKCMNFSFWIIAGLSGIITSLALSLMIFLFVSHDWDAYQIESGNIVSHVLVYTPYLWILLFLLFVLLAIYGLHHTKNGYKLENKKYAVLATMSILLISLIFAVTGISSAFHENLRNRVSAYKYAVLDKYNVWDNPQKGLLAGKITQIKDKDNFELQDFDQDSWHVQKQNTKFVPSYFTLVEGKNIKMMGHLCLPCPNKNTFIVTEIKPW